MPAAARARSAQGASQFAAGHAAARLASATTRPTASATCKPLSNRELGIFRVGIFTTLKTAKAVIIGDLRAAPPMYRPEKKFTKRINFYGSEMKSGNVA